jgi:hypothetical protein
MAAGLSVSDVVRVDIILTPPPAQFRNFGTLLIAGPSGVIDTGERIRQYTSIDGVLEDFGSTAPEALAAEAFFSQSPQPTELLIGAWAHTATSGVLHGAPFSPAQQVSTLAALQAISTGSMSVSVDGTPHALSGLNFTAATNLNGVASIIQAALRTAGATNAVVNWQPDAIARFNIKSGTTGTSSTVGYATATGSGADISATLKLTAATGASAPVAGVAIETPLQAATTLISTSQTFGSYALAFAPTAFTDLSDADHEAIAALVEASNPSHSYWATSNSAGIIDTTSTSDLASVLQDLNYNHTYLQYSSSSPYAAIASFAKFAVVDPTANNSMITLKFKINVGIVAETLTETQAAAIDSKNANVFVNYQNGNAIIQQGVMCSGQFADTIWGADWLQNNVQTRVWNLLYSNPTKIPQTEAGIHMIQTTVEAGLADAVFNGWCAPGVWNANGFGQLATGQALPKGYYVFARPLAEQAQSDRAARKAPTMQCAVKLSGAIHSANVQLNVNP